MLDLKLDKPECNKKKEKKHPTHNFWRGKNLFHNLYLDENAWFH